MTIPETNRLCQVLEYLEENIEPDINKLLAYFKPKCISYSKSEDRGLVKHKLVMKKVLWREKEIITINTIDGHLLTIAIHGLNGTNITEYNELDRHLAEDYDNHYIDLLATEGNLNYYGLSFSPYQVGVGKNVQISNDHVQILRTTSILAMMLMNERFN